MWLNLEIVIQSEVSQKERRKHCKISLTCGIWKNDTDEKKQNRDTDVENRCMDTKGRREREELRDWD